MTRLFFFKLCALSALALSGCATAFTGSAHVKDGRAGCEKKCTEQGLEFAGMVYMGEYSDACICATPGKSAEALSPGSVAGSSAGVMMQAQRSTQEQR